MLCCEVVLSLLVSSLFSPCSEMIPAVAARSLATFCDVFCEKGYFHAQHTEQVLLSIYILLYPTLYFLSSLSLCPSFCFMTPLTLPQILTAAKAHGMKLRIHAGKRTTERQKEEGLSVSVRMFVFLSAYLSCLVFHLANLFSPLTPTV